MSDKNYQITFLVPLSVFMILSLIVIASDVDPLVPTLALLSVTIAFPYLIKHLVQKALPDINYGLISSLFYLKIFVSFFILTIAWEPLLGGNEGYDPIRYFYYAKAFAESDFDLTTLGHMELLSPGIIYLYAFITKIIGWNPIIPFLINSILSFVACMVLTRTIFLIYGGSKLLFQFCALALLIPDVFWFDIITSRDSVTTFFLSSSVFLSMWLMDSGYRKSKSKGFLLVLAILFLISNVGLVVIRPGTILISTVIVLGIFLSTHRKEITLRNVTLFVLFLTMFAVIAPIIVFDMLNINRDFIESKFTVNKIIEVAQIYGDMTGDNSLSAKMIPTNLLDVVLYTPIKILAYMFVSITLIPSTMLAIINGDLSDTQLLFMGISSLVYIFLFPRFVLVCISSFAKQENFLAVFPFVATIVITVLSNQFIHERYRLMSIPFFIFSLYPSYAMPRERIAHVERYWLFSFAIIIIVYTYIKL